MFASKDVFLKSGAGGYTISRSVRLRSSASAYFNRTPASASNRTTWTWSGWVKRGTLATTTGYLFGAYSDANNFMGLRFGATLASGSPATDGLNAVFVSGGADTARIDTTQVFRDPSSWYHIVYALDTTQATAANRVKLYVNGTQVTSLATANYPSQNSTWYINNTLAQGIGAVPTLGQYLDGYLTEINFIDGQALTPSSFGQYNSYGVWSPLKYTGTYGTNGFYLNFSDNSATTAAAIGKDYSGNGNNWTPNNISVTAGVTYDSMTDVPTLTSATAANYATGNPVYADSSGAATYTNGNLTWNCPNVGSGKATISATTGKFYWEAVYLTNAFMTGVADVASVGRYNNSILYQSDGTKGINGTFTSYGATYTTGDVIGVALDLTGGTVTFYKNNASQGSISLSLASITNATAIIVGGGGSANTGNWNFGQRPFSYTPPSGYSALNTQNLPAGTITTSGSFTGNANTDGPFVYLNGVPTAMTINGNSVTFGTNADHLANGFKVRSSSASYNASGSNTYSITTTGANFKNAIAQTNP